MTKRKDRPTPGLTTPADRDPYIMRSIEQILGLFDGGTFIDKVMDGHKQLQIDLLEYLDENGPKNCQGEMTIKINYAAGKSGDVAMGARVDFKAPKKPPASAAAFINDKGELTLYSPLLRRMHQPVRDVTDFDPETGEVRDTH